MYVCMFVCNRVSQSVIPPSEFTDDDGDHDDLLFYFLWKRRIVEVDTPQTNKKTPGAEEINDVPKLFDGI